MEREEIEELIAKLKRELVIYQRRAEKMKVEDAQIEAQIDKFLESIHVLMKMLKQKKIKYFSNLYNEKKQNY